MIKISPQKLKGNWNDGYALDFHTISSEFIGYDGYGHPQFDTKYTEIGNLLYHLKYKNDKSVVGDIVKAAGGFVRSENWSIDLVIPIPPSVARSFQSINILAEELAEDLHAECCIDCVKKIKNTPQLKNVPDEQERVKLLKDAFLSDNTRIQGKNVLLIDDLYRSGATINEVASSLRKSESPNSIYALAVTMTRGKR